MSPNAFMASQSAAKTITVAKARDRAGRAEGDQDADRQEGAAAATVTVADPHGLAKAGGKAQVVLTKGKTTRRVKR